MKDGRGFTLVETMIVIAIVGILAMIAIPNYQLWVYHTRYTGFLRDVFTEFQQGRQRAIATSIAHTVEVDPVANTVHLRRASDNAYVRNIVVAPVGCDILSPSTFTNVTFNSNGSATSNGNVRIVNLHNAADNQMIMVTTGTGRVKIQ